jgi:hypothetical protein
MSKRKDTKSNSDENSFDIDWEEDGDVTLDDTWDPSAFQSDSEEADSFQNWEITLDDDLLENASWTEEPLKEEAIEESESSLDMSIPNTDTAEDLAPDNELDTLVVLPWETVGTLASSDDEFAVQLNPSQLHSTWCGPNPDERVTGRQVLTVQGICFEVEFQYKKSAAVALVLGRDVLENRILISIPKAH